MNSMIVLPSVSGTIFAFFYAVLPSCPTTNVHRAALPGRAISRSLLTLTIDPYRTALRTLRNRTRAEVRHAQ